MRPATRTGAHVEPREADPPAGGTAAAGWDEVTITFISVDPEVLVEVEVEGPGGRSITTGDATVAETTASGATVIVPVEPFEEGRHIVTSEAMSADGDGPSNGMFEFVAEERSTTGPSIWLLWIVALAIPAAIFLRPRHEAAAGRPIGNRGVRRRHGSYPRFSSGAGLSLRRGASDPPPERTSLSHI